MIKLFSVKKEQQKAAEDKKDGVRKLTPGEIRLQKDLSELNLEGKTTIEFPEGRDKTTHFHIVFQPVTGMYQGGSFTFDFNILPGYPHEAPKVRCLTKVYHPNIDTQGNVCLNILREDWKPVLSINSLVYGLMYLMTEPNPDDPLNREAAEAMRSNKAQFEQVVRRLVAGGGYVGTEHFPKCQGITQR